MSAPRREKRPVRIAGCSGGFTDRTRAISSLAQDPEVDAVIGDWLSEMTMTFHGAGKAKAKSLHAGGENGSPDASNKAAMYADTFIRCFEPAIQHLARNGTKLAVNAGASDTELLAQVCREMVAKQGYDLKIAWVEGDDVTEVVRTMTDNGEAFPSLVDGRKLKDWGFDPICAQCYLGGLGIAEAFRHGADIVICGRVADASPVIGVAAWWHGWDGDHLDELAGALVAGHLIECSAYVTGGYYSGFKDLLRSKKHLNLGFPIAEVDHRGECVLTKEKNTGGCITVDTATSQLVYEIQGPWYFNCDVVADLTNVQMAQIAEDRVHISGVKGLPPPPTTKVGITAFGGYQAEFHFYMVGLDMEQKCQWTKEQVLDAIGEDNLKRFSMLKFHQNGTSPIDPVNQDVATVDFRMFAQTRDPDLLRTDTPNGFSAWAMEVLLQSAPGISIGNDLRQMSPKTFYEYWVALLPQNQLQHRVHCLYGSHSIVSIPGPKHTRTYPRSQPSGETTNPVDLKSFGSTTRAPLGYVALGRSGDKASDCNVGFFVRHDDEWDWLRSFLTINKVTELLGSQEYKGSPIERFEMPAIRVVHFLLRDHLDRGYNSCSTYDTLGKNACEYLRAKLVDVPTRFLDRGPV